MAEIFDFDDLQTVKRFAQREGYRGLADYLPVLQAWDIPLDTAAELIRNGISFSEYRTDPLLLEEELPENVVHISALYRKEAERNAQAKREALEARVVESKAGLSGKHWLSPLFYGLSVGLATAGLLIGLSSLPTQTYPPFSEESLIRDPLCTSIEGLYICTDHSEHGQFFGSYWEYQELKAGRG